jgi:hypothetical protein
MELAKIILRLGGKVIFYGSFHCSNKIKKTADSEEPAA